MSRRLATVSLAVLAALGVGAGFARVDLPRPAFDLTYSTTPLDETGRVDPGAAPTRYYYKNHRSRIDNFQVKGGQPVLASSFILDCDSSRMVQVNWDQRQVVVMTFDEWKRMMQQTMKMASQYAARMPGRPAPAQKRPGATGGVVTTTTVWYDTTAQKDWFGLPARYVEYETKTESSPDACVAVADSVEHHVWTTELSLPLCIPPFDLEPGAIPTMEAGGGGCTDRQETNVLGKPRKVDFLLREETISRAGGARRSSGYEVTALSRETLPDTLFEPPAGFERLDMQGMMAGMSAAGEAMGLGAAMEAPPPKAAGVVRIGVALSLPMGAPADPRELQRRVVDWIDTQSGYDAVPLAAGDRASALAEAPGVDADYVLFYDVSDASIKVSKKGMLGGMVGGAVGARAAGGAVKLKVAGRSELDSVPDGATRTASKLDGEKSTEDPQNELGETFLGAARDALQALR